MTLPERQARCATTADLTLEHVIPAAIGGRLTCNFLCRHCNSTLGQIESQLRNDARIRLAIDNLKDSLPDLWTSMVENQPWIGKNQQGESVAGRIKSGIFSVDSAVRPDGSLIQSPAEGAKTIRSILQKSGASTDEISDAERNINELPENLRLRVATDVEIMKLTLRPAYPALNSQEIDPRALIKIAYECLALHLGNTIFHRYFERVRAFLKGGDFPDYCSVTPKRIRDKTYQPFHSLAARKTANGLVVKVRLFGYLSYPVEFYGLQIVSGGTYCYVLHLDARQEEWVKLNSA